MNYAKLNRALFSVAALLLAGCGGETRDVSNLPARVHAHEHAAAEWTCSMHPQVRSPEPGSCPLCGMDLIPVSSDGEVFEDPARPRLRLGEAGRALAEVETTRVERRAPEARIRLVGTLAYDETRARTLSARFPARIEKLFVNYTGATVERGAPLAEVYSAELLSAQREFLVATRGDPQGAVARAARERLLRWDLLPEQIDELARRGEATDRFELRAQLGGVVVSKEAREGDYVQTGQALFQIVDLSQLWLELEAFESDVAWLQVGQAATFEVDSYPGERFRGRVTFIDPVVDPQTRAVGARVDVSNEKGRLRPGMFAKAEVISAAAFEETSGSKWTCPMHPEIVEDSNTGCPLCGMDLEPVEEGEGASAAPLLVPASATLLTGKRAVVYIEKSDTDGVYYEGREIALGPRAGDFYVVRSGVAEGERVVTRGAFKIDSELQIRAKRSMMSRGEAEAHPHGH